MSDSPSATGSRRDLRDYAGFTILCLAVPLMFFLALLSGQVEIPASRILATLFLKDTDPVCRAIVLEARLPMAATALLAGAGLSVAGLILQTVFRNPLAGPSLLGVSSGAGLGVAVAMMGASIGLSFGSTPWGEWLQALTGAVAGAMAVIAILISFSSIVRNGVMLLIIGVMLSYLASSFISLLNFFAEAERLRNFTVWSLGSYSGVTLSRVPGFAMLAAAGIVAALMYVKPLNALLLGERYATSMGYSIRRTRTILLLISGILTAVVTAYCGPIGFIGLIVPHLSRLMFRSSNHSVILPASALTGAAVSLLCVILANNMMSEVALPVNVVTPILGVPVIIYLIIRRNSIPYFK